jgi:hypothetical protein
MTWVNPKSAKEIPHTANMWRTDAEVNRDNEFQRRVEVWHLGEIDYRANMCT